MSTYGSRTQRFVEVMLERKWTSEDYNPPGDPLWTFRVNGLELDFRRFSKRCLFNRWSYYSGALYTPWFSLCFWRDLPFLCEEHVHGDFPDRVED